MEQMMQQGPPQDAEQVQPDSGGAGIEELTERFAQVAMSEQFAEVVQGAFDQVPNPVNAVAFLLAQMVQQVEAKIGPLKDEVLFADGGPAQVFVAIVLAMAEEAGLEGAGTTEAASAALSIAATMLATSEVMAEMQAEGQGEPQGPGPQGPPQGATQFGGLMA